MMAALLRDLTLLALSVISVTLLAGCGGGGEAAAPTPISFPEDQMAEMDRSLAEGIARCWTTATSPCNAS